MNNIYAYQYEDGKTFNLPVHPELIIGSWAYPNSNRISVIGVFRITSVVNTKSVDFNDVEGGAMRLPNGKSVKIKRTR